MSRFFSVIPVDEAVAIARRLATTPRTETVPVAESAGRVLAADIAADLDIPGFDRSVVDGYALRSEDTAGATDATPIPLRCRGTVAMGHPDPTLIIGQNECAYIPTGGVLPAGADAAVMVEHVAVAGDTVLIRKPAGHGENVLFRDDDFRKGETVLSSGRRLMPQDAGVLSACGCTDVPVVKRPVIGILSTGNELIPAARVPGPGQIRDANAPMLAAWLTEYGCEPRVYGIARDERATFEALIARALPECDALLISGGSSKDERDMTARIIAEQGEVLVHGIALAPGKPTIIGNIGGTPVFGLPGHPGATFVVLVTIVRPFLDAMLGLTQPVIRTTRATLAENIPSQKGREEYVRVRLEGDVATPIFGKSGLLNTLVKSNGLVRIPSGAEGLEKGSEIEVQLW